MVEDNFSILALPIADSIQHSLTSLLSQEAIEDAACCENSDLVEEHRFSACGKFLVVHIPRFKLVNGVPLKDSRIVDACVDNLVVPVTMDDEVVIARPFKLLATINHSGTLNHGHYTSHVVDPANDSWWLCNDKAVTPITLPNLSNGNSTVFFYERSDT